ncbi:type II secretion system F family protein [Rhizobium sp. PP-CC-3G-465]|uniref:type II secretion system F family protein n=1 Tax=Rhizobium sp. PP-CC-3G-465 TaxID=2135648 RepID=UPI001042C5F5|nr:type II secretion system protein F (GspF) [Rhizobium sp. PP-CC-3G-465]
MTVYRYVAQTAEGRKIKGEVQALSRESAARLVVKSGCHLLEISEITEQRTKFFKQFRGTKKRKANFRTLLSELSLLLEAGFTIDAALKALNATNKGLEVRAVSDAIASGKSFSEAVRPLSGGDETSIALIVSGEHSGQLGDVVSLLSKMYEDEKKRSSEALEALVYPAFLAVMITAAIGIVTFALVPAIDPIFEGMENKRPLSIAVLASLRVFLITHGWLLFGIVAMFISLLAWLGTTAAFRIKLSAILLQTPVVGLVVRKRGCARYLHVLGMLLQNGVGMKRSLGLAAKACPISAYHSRLFTIQEAVGAGEPFRNAARKADLFDATTMSLVVVGDEANRLPEALKRAAFLLDADSSKKIQRILLLLTPAVTVVMGVAIGGLVLSLMDALLSINDLAMQ